MTIQIKGIYIITNTLNNKYYVGSSLDVKKRLSGHLNNLRKKKHHCIHLQNAFNKYGEENFKTEIVLNLNDCDTEIIRAIEQEILDKDFDNQYNSSRKAIGVIKDKDRESISNTMKGKRNHNFGKKLINDHNRKSGGDVLFNKKSNKWRACISIQGDTIHLGCFDTEIEAIEARLKAEKVYWAKDYIHYKRPVCIPLNYKKKGKKFEVSLQHNGKVHYKTLNIELEAYEYVKDLRNKFGITY